jgi:collagenase-like PrtC family protease
MSCSALAGMMQSHPDGVESEVLIYGRLPLALSARCFTARRYNLQKDDCQFRCLEHPEGLALRTREGQPFLVLNGVQTQSARILNLAREIPEMARLGVDIVRISPRPAGMREIAALLKRALQDPGEAAEVAARLDGFAGAETCNGFWHGAAGIKRVPAAVH